MLYLVSMVVLAVAVSQAQVFCYVWQLLGQKNWGFKDVEKFDFHE